MIFVIVSLVIFIACGQNFDPFFDKNEQSTHHTPFITAPAGVHLRDIGVTPVNYGDIGLSNPKPCKEIIQTPTPLQLVWFPPHTTPNKFCFMPGCTPSGTMATQHSPGRTGCTPLTNYLLIELLMCLRTTCAERRYGRSMRRRTIKSEQIPMGLVTDCSPC